MIRLLDLLFSTLGLLFLFPIFVFISILIKINSKGPVFYVQRRVGIKGRLFLLLKFRTMYTDLSNVGLQITIGDRDPRITSLGFFLRKYKLDELPQLFNVFVGNMSIVGPRPEVEKYVMKYTHLQKKVLEVKPGITDIASIVFRNENALLANYDNPEEVYMKIIMPRKILLNMSYIEKRNVFSYFKIIFMTLTVILLKDKGKYNGTENFKL
jgi:lipopolysaccharide/colanic/teichoic acid biosynthesis glycosyltransferase